MFLNVMTPLIMVLGFSDSMQLTFAARDRLLHGDSKFEAMRRAILVVGPACVLTSLAAGLSFVALLFSDSHLIRAFGAAGAMSAAIAFVAVITLMPLLGVLLVRKEANFAAKVAGADMAINALRGFCTWIAERMVRRPLPYTIASVIVVLGLTAVYANLEPYSSTTATALTNASKPWT
jgi:predicted RND superfamily exporter protein